MPERKVRMISGDAPMRAFGKALIAACRSGGVITLSGDLGTGKTTLVRGALESVGVTGGVRSPTYTLVEYYERMPLSIAHFDLYRLADAEELEYLGFRDYLNTKTLCFIEWPERANGMLKDAGLQVLLDYRPGGRKLHLIAKSDWGQNIVDQL